MREKQYRKLKECLHSKNYRGKSCHVDYDEYPIRSYKIPVKKRSRPLNVFKNHFPIKPNTCATSKRGDDKYWDNDRSRRVRFLKMDLSPYYFNSVRVVVFINTNGNWTEVRKLIRRGK